MLFKTPSKGNCTIFVPATEVKQFLWNEMKWDQPDYVQVPALPVRL